MRTTAIAAFVVSMAAAAFAQGGGNEERDIERRVNRLKDSLKLNEEQTAKAKEIYKADAEAQNKLDKERTDLEKARQDKIRELLTDDQKKSYDDYLQGGGRGGRGNQGGGGQPGGGFGGGRGGWMENMLGPTTDQLKKDLDLTEDQVSKIGPILDEARKKAQDRMEELRQNGFQGLNWREEMDNYRKGQEEIHNKVKEHLTEEQKTKYDAANQRRMNPFGGGNPGGGRTPTEERRGPSVDERVKRAMDALKIENADEAAAIKELIKKVAEAQVALETWDRESRPKIDEVLGNKELKEEDLEGKLKEFRGQRKEKETGVKDAQKALAEVVSYRQELELIKQNILR
jgi:hypothetical protein